MKRSSLQKEVSLLKKKDVIDFGRKFINYFLKARPFHSYKYFFRYHNNGVALKKRVNLLQIFDI